MRLPYPSEIFAASLQRVNVSVAQKLVNPYEALFWQA